MAEDPTEEVTIQYPHTGETRGVARGALAHFVNDEQGWVVLDAAGRKKANQPATTTDSKGV